MYIPKHFEVNDPALLHALMQRFNFATLVTSENGLPVATHLPVMVKPDAGTYGYLVGHLARANKQWQAFHADSEVLTIFQGHHAYISPSWYASQPSVPTWNYMVVHAYGVPQIIDDYERIVPLLDELVTFHESGFEQPWPMALDEAYLRKMIKGIVAFEIRLTRLEGKFKLSQNRAMQDRAGVIEALAGSADPLERELAQIMAQSDS